MTDWTIRLRFKKDSDTLKYEGIVDINSENFDDVAEELYSIMQGGGVKVEVILVDAV